MFIFVLCIRQHIMDVSFCPASPSRVGDKVDKSSPGKTTAVDTNENDKTCEHSF